MDDLLFQTTLMTARRLLKSRLRLFLSRLKASEPDGEDSWGSAILLEEGVEQEARVAWRNVRQHWASNYICRAMLQSAADQAFRQAKADVVGHFVAQDVDPKWLRSKLRGYRAALD